MMWYNVVQCICTISIYLILCKRKSKKQTPFHNLRDGHSHSKTPLQKYCSCLFIEEEMLNSWNISVSRYFLKNLESPDLWINSLGVSVAWARLVNEEKCFCGPRFSSGFDSYLKKFRPNKFIRNNPLGLLLNKIYFDILSNTVWPQNNVLL